MQTPMPSHHQHPHHNIPPISHLRTGQTRPLLTPAAPAQSHAHLHLTPCQWQRAQGLLLIFLEDALVLATRYSRHNDTVVTPRILIDCLKAQAQLGVERAPRLEERLRAYTELLRSSNDEHDEECEEDETVIHDDGGSKEDVTAFLQRHVSAWPAWVPQDDVQRILQQTIDHMDACIQDHFVVRDEGEQR